MPRLVIELPGDVSEVDALFAVAGGLSALSEQRARMLRDRAPQAECLRIEQHAQALGALRRALAWSAVEAA